jgi:hypothetical protein
MVRLIWNLPFANEKYETQFFAINLVENRCGGNRCAEYR